jgi:hypothetical protein
VRKIFTAAAVYTGLGLVGGVYYRELTKAEHFTGTTQLSVVHTHLLALGMLFFLVVLALEKSFTLTASRWFPLFFVVYQAGLGLAVTMFLVHGTLTVLGHQTGQLISYVAGLGHVGLTAGLVFFLLALKDRLDAAQAAEASTAQTSTAA